MVPLLQARTDELPYCPQQLNGIAFLTVYCDCQELPVDLPAVNGEGWLIRTYDSVDSLDPWHPPVIIPYVPSLSNGR